MKAQAVGVHTLRRQQTAIANFAAFAVRQNDQLKIMTEAARVCAECFGVRFCGVYQYRPAEHDLLVIAGCGFEPGVVGRFVSRADESSPRGRAFLSAEPWIVADSRADDSFSPPDFSAAQVIISSIGVIIKRDDRPYGVLEIGSDTQRSFDQYDIDLLTAFAGILSEFVAAAARTVRREAAFRHLADSEARFRTAFDAAPGAQVMFGIDRRITMINARAERTFGYSKAEVLGCEVDMLLPARLQAKYPAVPSDDFSGSPSRPTEEGEPSWGLHKDGHEFQAEIELNSFEINGDIVMLSSIADVSARVWREAQSRQAQKMEAIGRLTAGIAHDFNNLLQALTGALELLVDHVDDRPDAWEYGQIALRAAKRGGELTHRLLAFSRQQQLTPGTVPVSELFDDVACLITNTFGPDIRLAVAPFVAGLTVIADAAQLRAAILSLAMNAGDAMNGSGPLTISAHTAEAEAPMPPSTDGYIVIAIEDAGTGMDETTIAKACEPFFTTKGFNGSGLGLAMVQGFARQSGGDVRIVSALGHGTRVEIWLPSAKPLEGARANTAARKSSSLHILLVDDEADVLKTIGAFLRTAGYLVTTADSGDEALARLVSGDRFDAIVTDFAMSGLNGLDLMRHAREIDETLPGLIITGYHDTALGDALDGSDILRKPFDRATIIARVDALVTSRKRIPDWLPDDGGRELRSPPPPSRQAIRRPCSG